MVLSRKGPKNSKKLKSSTRWLVALSSQLLSRQSTKNNERARSSKISTRKLRIIRLWKKRRRLLRSRIAVSSLKLTRTVKEWLGSKEEFLRKSLLFNGSISSRLRNSRELLKKRKGLKWLNAHLHLSSLLSSQFLKASALILTTSLRWTHQPEDLSIASETESKSWTSNQD